MENDKTLVKYLRGNGRRRGVLFAYPVPELGKFALGFSLCHDSDTFDQKLGLHIACARAEASSLNVPCSIKEEVRYFLDRCRKYYKDLEAPKWTENL